MSKYPAAVAGQGLYEASTTKKHALGTVQSFDTDVGVVEAVYVQWYNATSVAAGFAVARPWDSDAPAWSVDTAPIANVSAGRSPGWIMGVLCCSMQGTNTSNAATGYGWVARRGPVTNAAVAANIASNSLLYVSVNSAARLATVATALATSNVPLWNHLVGVHGATASTLSRASTTAVAGHYVHLFWR